MDARARVSPRWLVISLAVLACAIVLAVVVIAVRVRGGPAPPRSWQNSAKNTEVFSGGLWLNPQAQPVVQAAQLRAAGLTTDASAIDAIANEPIATWLTDSNSPHVVAALKADLTASAQAESTPVFVTYAIPDRDCSGYSAGGATSDSAYLAWNRSIAARLRGHHAVVLIEPDSIAMLGQSDCGSITRGRLALIRTVVEQYARDHIDVYLDGGNSHWQKPSVMAARLKEAGVADARGFFTNVSNFYPVDQERAYADEVSRLLNGKHFVIDVSRDGAGWKGSWCNPKGAALGQNPHVTAGTGGLDALLWVKTPGASDGTCDGGPPAGQWNLPYALALVANRSSS